MNEKEWMAHVLDLISHELVEKDQSLTILQGKKLPYTLEIESFTEEGKQRNKILTYETDLLINEIDEGGKTKPRLVIEGKLSRISTHSAITYSKKASTHKNVFPFIRYGILIGNRKHYPLPGRLFRHGAYFDFMLSWKAYEPKVYEIEKLMEVIISEVDASRKMEEILYKSRNPNRTKYFVLHRPLDLEEFPEDID